MREIFFRGKRIDNGEFIIGSYAVKGIGTDLKKHFIVQCEFNGALTGYPFYFTDIEVNKATVGQFTGLLDKNGTRIFEGDIIKYVKNNIVHTGVVKYFKDAFDVYLHGTNAHSLRSCLDTLEVIGNIHDNPELLEAPQ